MSTQIKTRYDIIREVQEYCADLADDEQLGDTFPSPNGHYWTEKDGAHVASLLNQDADPWGLFAYMDEKTGASDVGYRTKDGREWHYVLRQMRNTVGSGLFENLRTGS